MEQTLLFTLIFFLAACTSAPQVTVTSEVTVTLPPPPTNTPAPTPTPVAVDGVATIDGIHYIFDEVTQNWVALPELDAEFARVLVTEDGRIVAVDANGAEVYALDMATGKWVEAQARLENGVGEPELREDGRYYQSNSDGVEYMLAGDEWVRTFPECSFGEYRTCPVEIADIPAMQDYVRALVTPEMFNLDNLKNLKMNEFKLTYRSVLVPDIETAPNYEGADAERAPFIKDNNWNGVTAIDGVTHVLVNIPYVVEDGNGGHKVIVMSGLRAMKGGGYDVSNTDEFNNRMNIIPWRIDPESIELATRFVNPATGENFTNGEVKKIIEEMRQGNFANADGLVLYFVIGKNSGGWFE